MRCLIGWHISTAHFLLLEKGMWRLIVRWCHTSLLEIILHAERRFRVLGTIIPDVAFFVTSKRRTHIIVGVIVLQHRKSCVTTICWCNPVLRKIIQILLFLLEFLVRFRSRTLLPHGWRVVVAFLRFSSIKGFLQGKRADVVFLATFLSISLLALSSLSLNLIGLL